MDITFLRNEDKLCGVYLEGGILLDAGKGVGAALKSAGLEPKTVLLTSMSGGPVAGLSELEGVPVGYVPSGVEVSQFPVGSQGYKKYGFRLKTQDGELVYAPEFDRLEKSRLAGADVAILDPGDRSEKGDLAGLSHKSFLARERMTANALVGTVIWADDHTDVYTLVSKAMPVTDECADDDADCKAKKAKPKTDTGYKSESPKIKEIDLSNQISEINEAFREFEFKMPVDNSRMYSVVTTDEYLIVCFYGGYGSDYSHRYFKVPYTKSGDVYTFSEPQSWTEVEIESKWTEVSKSQFVITKEDDGEDGWMSISSSNFKDSDGETVLIQAMDVAIAIAQKRGSAGDLVWEHYDELPLGPCTSQTRVGRFLVEKGKFYDTPLAKAAKKKLKEAEPGKYRVSIGFKYWDGTRSDNGEYSFIDIFHRATTTRPSNAATSIEVIKSMKELTQEARKAIQADLGLTDEEMNEVIAAAKPKEAAKSEADPKVALKEEVTPAAESEAEKKLKAELDQVKKDTAAEIEALKTKLKSDVKIALTELLKDAPKTEITRGTETGKTVTADEQVKIAAEVAKSASDKIKSTSEFEDSFYSRFSSKAV